MPPKSDRAGGELVDRKRERDRTSESALSRSDLVHLNVRQKIGTMGNPRKMGKCYPNSYNYLQDLASKRDKIDPKSEERASYEDIWLVHGNVTQSIKGEGVTFDHAWVENGQNTCDISTGQPEWSFTAEYREHYNVVERVRYSPEESKEMLEKYRYHGPWDLYGEAGLSKVTSLEPA